MPIKSKTCIRTVAILPEPMLIFCPLCSNALGVKEQSLFCQCCPYVYNLEGAIGSRIPFTPKRLEDVLGGEAEWKNVDQTDATCPKCEHSRAYFMQIQIRSADEPSTIFYRCTECTHQW